MESSVTQSRCGPTRSSHRAGRHKGQPTQNPAWPSHGLRAISGSSIHSIIGVGRSLAPLANRSRPIRPPGHPVQAAAVVSIGRIKWRFSKIVNLVSAKNRMILQNRWPNGRGNGRLVPWPPPLPRPDTMQDQRNDSQFVGGDKARSGNFLNNISPDRSAGRAELGQVVADLRFPCRVAAAHVADPAKDGRLQIPRAVVPAKHPEIAAVAVRVADIANSHAPIAILENCPQADGSIIIPAVLCRWLGKDRIGGNG